MIESWFYFSMVVLCFVGCVQLGFFVRARSILKDEH